MSDNKLQKTINLTSKFSESEGTPKVGFVGAGNYASRILIPAFQKTNCEIKVINASTGLSSYLAAKSNEVQKYQLI